jgi:hypothetical protein
MTFDFDKHAECRLGEPSQGVAEGVRKCNADRAEICAEGKRLQAEVEHLEGLARSLKKHVFETEAENARLRGTIGALLDSVDYTSGACGMTEMVGAVLPKELITMARAALAGEGEG